MLSAYEPPSDPADIEAWLLEREEEIAKATVKALTRIIDRSLDAFVSSLTASGDMSAFDGIPTEWATFVREDLADRLGGMYLSGGVSAWVQSPGTDDLPESTLNAWTDVVNGQAVEYAGTATNRLTGPVADSIWNDLRQKVSNAVATGMSTEKLTEQVLLMGEFATYRAEMIARTEVNGAYNNGNYQSNQALGEWGPVEKYWIATGDDRTRPTHRAADGQVRAFNMPFNVGTAEMLYPHDPAGPASEVVNCRCVTAYLYPGMERPDGTIVPEVQAPATPAPKPTRAVDFDDPDVRADLLEDAYDFVDPDTGWQTETDTIYQKRNGQTKIVGNILDEDGTEIGYFERGISPNGVVEHIELSLEAEFQGNGFASRFNAQAEQIYRSKGVQAIELEAGLEVGGYAWARQGYQLNLSDTYRLEDVIETFRTAFLQKAKRRELPAGEIDRLLGFIERNDMAGLASDPLGKKALLRTEWRGIKRLI